MDLITQTSLEALLLKATNSENQNIDTAAVEAFCTLINKEKDGAHIGVKVLAARLSVGKEKEMLQTLNVLDTCMSRCGAQFQSEVGKFRFLNEMIKLVSPKYLGLQTPQIVKQKVLQLMYIWTLDYPKEAKIKEAYDMLRKQGVIKEIPNPNVTTPISNASRQKSASNSIFQDEEKSKILQKLLQSKDPEDIQTANWLIKSMVKEDDKRAEMKSRKIYELESVRNNVRLLNEMLDSYKANISSGDELDLIKELHQSCERLRPNLMRLVTETQQSEDILGDILQANDELGQVFIKYTNVIVKGKRTMNGGDDFDDANHTLLDFETALNASGDGAKCASKENKTMKEEKKEIDVLCDIFNAANIPNTDENILQPVAVLACDKNEDVTNNTKSKGLEDLDVLSEHLFRENLQSSRQIAFNKVQDKIPMNLLTKTSETKENDSSPAQASLNFDLNYLITKEKPKRTASIDNEGDDILVDISCDEILLQGDDQENNNEQTKKVEETKKEKPLDVNDSSMVKNNDLKLNDIIIKLEDIEPSTKPPLTILNERNGISITLHFVKDKPRDDVNVFVVTTISKNEMPLSNYLFQAVVPKGCKLKLQPPSSNNLPKYNPFLPPSVITQIMLISTPADNNVKVFLKFIVSYVMDDETCTEMGEVEELPIN